MRPTLGNAVWPSVEDRSIVLVPLGSVEQHGPHLPLATDSFIAEAVAERAVQRLVDEGVAAVLAPSLAYGASGEHQDFPGTVSMGTEALASVVLELGRSICHWASGVVFINGHGGNLEGVRRAVETLRAEQRPATWVNCTAANADAHAGRTETSLMLALNAEDVLLADAVRGNTESLEVLLPHLRQHGVRTVSPSGVLGDPTGGSAEEGLSILNTMAEGALDSIVTALALDLVVS